MRKKVNAVIILILAMCLLTMVACKDRDEDGLIKPKAPTNLELSGSTLSWDEVDNAQRYSVFVEETDEEASTASTSYDLSAIVTGYGDFTITVRAYGDGVTYGKSDRSKPFVYHKGLSLDAPRVAVDNAAKTASWSGVDNAASYSIKVYNSKDALVDERTQSETSYSFADKNDAEGKDVFEGYDKYRIAVVAVPSDNSKYSNSEKGTSYYIHSTTLSVPAFKSMTASRIQWDTVANATSYTLKMTYVGADGATDSVTADTTGTSYQRSNFNYDRVGEYSFTIKANGDNEVFIDSDFSEKNDSYAVSKLQGIDAQNDIRLAYDADGKAKLTWSIDANTVANQFYLTLVGLLPDGTSKLENSDTSMTVSCKVVWVSGKVYNFYQYKDSAKSMAEAVAGQTVTIYNIDGDFKARYNGADYFVKSTAGDKLRYSAYSKSDGVDIVFDGTDFIYDRNVAVDGGSSDQYTGDEEELRNSDGNRLYYFEETSSDEIVAKRITFNSSNEPVSFDFEITLDDIFIRKVEDNGLTTYEYKISDSYYGILYNVSVSAGHSDSKYVASDEALTEGQYLSYKIPLLSDGKYVVSNAGEYAYIAVKNYIDAQNGVTAQSAFAIDKNINFGGYEVVQIENFNGIIEGGRHTLSNLVVGNKQMSADGVVVKDLASGSDVIKRYAQYVNIQSGARIDDAFYMGVNFVGYKKEDVESGVSEIYVAPIAINNYGAISGVFVQSDAIKADSATVGGMVINNYGGIGVSQVYADLEGRNVAGVAINNYGIQSGISASIYDTGFYGSINAKAGEYLSDQPTEIAAAGLVLYNKNTNGGGTVLRCEAIGSVKADASNLDAVYAGGLVAYNSGSVLASYSGEYKRYDTSARKEIIANGDNAFAGGLVAHNAAAGTIDGCYATNRAGASKYAGGLVGLNEGVVSKSYAIGGTIPGGTNNGVFAGKNSGTVTNAAAYSSDGWAREDDYFTLITKESDLADIVDILYGQGNRDMKVTDEEGFRYPILIGRTYTKDYVVEMRPQEIPTVGGIAVMTASSEVKNITVEESDICGDRSSRGNKVVIVLNVKDNASGGNYVKLVLGKIK